MNKIFLFFTFLMVICYSNQSISQTRLPGSSQTQDEGVPVDFDKETLLKKDIDDVGLAVANKLMRCCSSWGGNNVYAKVTYEEVRHNTITGAFTIPMMVGWYGSLTGTHYWIIGKLIVNSDGRKEWLKVRDSGGFNPGCSKDCIN